MPTTLRSPTVRVAVSFAAAVALVACGGDDDDAATTTDDVEVTDGAATTEVVETTEAAETTEVETTDAAATTEVVETTDAAETTAAPDTTSEVTTDTAEGSPYTSAEGDYTVVFPAAPTEQTQSEPLPDGETVDLVFAGYELDDGFIATARGQYPDNYVLDVPVALQGAQDQALANVSGTLLTSQDITLQGRPGREFSATITNGGQTGTLLQRVYLDGLVIYQQIFTGAGEMTFDDPDVATFFSSFAFATG
jgi:hypothetical protein